jgi:hypothetical protein
MTLQCTIAKIILDATVPITDLDTPAAFAVSMVALQTSPVMWHKEYTLNFSVL